MSKHHMTRASEVYRGAAHYGPAYDANGRVGIETAHLFVKKFGAIVTADPDGAVVGGTATEATTLSMSGALVADSIATFDVPRAVSLTCTADNSGVDFTVTGTDEYGEALVETITGPNNTTVTGKKAFKTVTSIASDGAVTGDIDAGSSDTIGLPIRAATKGDILSISVDGKAASATGTTVVAGLTTTQTSTATTGDVRGTIAFGDDASDGSKLFTVLVNVADAGSKAAAYGVDQYGG